MRARLVESQPEVPSMGQLPKQGMSVSPELGAHSCCLRPDLLLEAQFLEHYCCVPVHLPSPSGSQAKGNNMIELQECEGMGPGTPNLLCSLPFFRSCYSVCFFLFEGGKGYARSLPFSQALVQGGRCTSPFGKQHSQAWEMRGQGRALQECLSNSGKANLFDIISVRKAKSVCVPLLWPIPRWTEFYWLVPAVWQSAAAGLAMSAVPGTALMDATAELGLEGSCVSLTTGRTRALPLSAFLICCLWAGEAGRDESVTRGGRGALSYRPCQNVQGLAENLVLFPFFSRLWHCVFMGVSWKDALKADKVKEGLQVASHVFVIFGNSASQVPSFWV